MTSAKSPRLIARIAGVLYLMVFVTGIFSLIVRSRVGVAAAFIAGVLYIGDCALLFHFQAG